MEDSLPWVYLPVNVSLLVVASFMSCYLASFFIFDQLRHIPGPFWSRFGNLYAARLTAGGKVDVELKRLHSRYGPLVRIGANQVHTADPRAVPTIYSFGERYLKTDFYDIFALQYKGRTVDSLLSTRTPGRHRIALIQNASVTSRVDMRLYEAAFDRTFEKFCRLTARRRSEPIDIETWILFWAFDVNCAQIFDHEYGFMEANDDVNGVWTSVSKGTQIVGMIGQLPGLARFLNSRFMNGILKALDGSKNYRMELLNMVEELMDAREREPIDAENCMYVTLRKAWLSEQAGMNREALVIHCADIFLAGAMPTTTVYQSILYHLAKDRRCRKILENEVMKTSTLLGADRLITYEQAIQLPYLQAVIQEAGRILPSPGLPSPRTVPKGGADICGYSVPEGTSISAFSMVIHSNKEIFGDDADRFRPERWIEADESTLAQMKRNTMTFGGGDYACKGQRRALRELSKFTFEVVRRFEIGWAGGAGEDWKVTSYWAQHLEGALLRFQPRDIAL